MGSRRLALVPNAHEAGDQERARRPFYGHVNSSSSHKGNVSMNGLAIMRKLSRSCLLILSSSHPESFVIDDQAKCIDGLVIGSAF